MASISKSERPKITIPLRPLDYTLEGLAVFSLLLLIRIVKAFVMLLFAFLVWRTISIVRGEAEGLGNWPLLVVISITLGTTFLYIQKSSAKK